MMNVLTKTSRWGIRELLLAVGLLALYAILNTAIARDVMVCNWGNLQNARFIGPSAGSFRDIIGPQIVERREAYDCDLEGCRYRYYWSIPNRTYTMTASATVNCINIGDTTAPVRFSFEKAPTIKPEFFQNLTMRITGAGSLALSGLENMGSGEIRSWSDGTLGPCQRNCFTTQEGYPNYTKTLNLTFTVRPIKTRIDGGPQPNFNGINLLGRLWVHQSSDDAGMSYHAYGIGGPGICGLMNSDMSGCAISDGGGGAGPAKPPVPQCTLTITTPGVVEFQPISSDDLSRNRVRMEDFTLTATKGPIQSQVCTGSTYNLPGTIKTEGGYAISSTFWGINHSSGAPQGIGLKLYDLNKGNYLQFNHTYPAFIANISSMSETKRIRAEIAATTNDLKRIKDGEYSQVLIFEVRMP